MNATKLVSFLARASAVSLAAAFLGLALNAHALALFALAVGLFVLLLVVTDYAPRTAEFSSRPAPDQAAEAATSRRAHALRLAA